MNRHHPHAVDKQLLVLTAILFVGGLFVLGSASMMLSYKNLGSVTGYAARQLLLGGGVGIVAMYATSRISYRTWRKFALPLLLMSFVCLGLLFVPQLKMSFGGATRWLKLGPVSFQPSELLKLTFVIYLASWLDSRRREVGSVSYGMIPFALMVSVVAAFLIMQPDVGTLIVVLMTAGFMYLLGGGKTSQAVVLGMLGIGVLYLVVQLAPYRLARLLVFLNPGSDPQGAGYQISKAFIAIGSGGFWGQGFGKSVQKYQYLPEPMGDSIFAIFAEEMGFFCVALLITCFLLFFIKGLGVAKRAPDVFGKLLAAGITAGFMSPAFINIGAVSGLMPLTGIPLPVVFYGGTSLAITLAGVGILLNISRHT